MLLSLAMFPDSVVIVEFAAQDSDGLYSKGYLVVVPRPVAAAWRDPKPVEDRNVARSRAIGCSDSSLTTGRSAYAQHVT